MGSKKKILQRKHDQALMDAESPRTAHNSITFKVLCCFLWLCDLMAFIMA